MADQPETVLVTGGAGFIGSHLALKLVGDGLSVVVFDNLLPQVHGNQVPRLPSGVRLVRGDMRDPGAVARVVEEIQPSAVIHLAAETGTGQSHDEVARYCDVNVSGTAHLIEAVRRFQSAGRRPCRIVLASSRSIYGEGAYLDDQGQLVVPPARSVEEMEKGRFAPGAPGSSALRPTLTAESTPPSPASVYASTKLMQEHLLRQALEGSRVQPAILRFQNVYGPGQSLRNPYTGVLSIFSEQILSGQTLEIYEDGDIVRDFVYVEDVADAVRAAMRASAPASGPINVGSGTGVRIIEVAQMLLELYGRPRTQLRVSGAFRPGDVRYAVADIALAERELGWRPTTSLADGLGRLARWVLASRDGSGESAEPDAGSGRKTAMARA